MLTLSTSFWLIPLQPAGLRFPTCRNRKDRNHHHECRSLNKIETTNLNNIQKHSTKMNPNRVQIQKQRLQFKNLKISTFKFRKKENTTMIQGSGLGRRGWGRHKLTTADSKIFQRCFLKKKNNRISPAARTYREAEIDRLLNSARFRVCAVCPHGERCSDSNYNCN